MTLYTNSYTKNQIATLIAIVFHTIGLIGILVFDHPFFIHATPFNLILSFLLILYTQKEKGKYFYAFLILAILVGIAVEIIGVNTGWLFGAYHYSDILGVKLFNVPILIGINWFIIIFCCGISINTLLRKMIKKISVEMQAPPTAVKTISVIIDGATLAVFFDWIMEPVAMKLGYWQWENDHVPIFNYICWFLISIALLSAFQALKFNKQNKFAVHLLLIQSMFFLILRTFL